MKAIYFLPLFLFVAIALAGILYSAFAPVFKSMFNLNK
jgi:hypothetical protein